MAMGKPVIGTKIGGIPNIIKDGVNGILVPAGDENALADALSGLIADKALSRSLSLQGRKMVEEMFSEHVMESCFRHLLNRVV
jgi:glycosyltransferase involved in cell wall biosynthesis